jgi:hypothetical protein
VGTGAVTRFAQRISLRPENPGVPGEHGARDLGRREDRGQTAGDEGEHDGSAHRACQGQWQTGDPDIVIVTDAGYDVTRLAWVLRDLPVEFGRAGPR